jgi:hypothetical protein
MQHAIWRDPKVVPGFSPHEQPDTHRPRFGLPSCHKLKLGTTFSKKQRRDLPAQACGGVMKANTISSTVRNLAASTALTTLSVLPLPAMSQSPTSAAPAPQRMNLDFGENTTLQDAVNHLIGMFRQKNEPVNALLKGDGTSVSVPVMSLQQVTFEQGVRAVALACDPPAEVDVAGPNVLVVRVLTRDEMKARNTKMRAFNVGEFLRREGAGNAAAQLKVLEGAISAGIKARSHVTPVDDPVLEAHLEGGLLFAQGDATTLEVVAEVVQALCPTAAAAHPAKP